MHSAAEIAQFCCESINSGNAIIRLQCRCNMVGAAVNSPREVVRPANHSIAATNLHIRMHITNGVKLLQALKEVFPQGSDLLQR